MRYNQITIVTNQAYKEVCEAIAIGISNSGIYTEDYINLESDILQLTGINLIEQSLLDADKDIVKIHLYLASEQDKSDVLPLINERLINARASFTILQDTVAEQDYATSWKSYYHYFEVGNRLAVRPCWEEAVGERTEIVLDPGMAFGTGTHETTFLCLEILDERIKGGEQLLDIGTGSGILAIAAAKLGAGRVVAIDIDPVAVRTAKENAAVNKVHNVVTVQKGNLCKDIFLKFNIITANLVADLIIKIKNDIAPLLQGDGIFIASGIINERCDEVIKELESSGLRAVRVYDKKGWNAIVFERNESR